MGEKIDFYFKLYHQISHSTQNTQNSTYQTQKPTKLKIKIENKNKTN